MIRTITLEAIEPLIEVAWQTRATRALEAIEQVPSADRSAAIDARQSIWKDLKPVLAGLSNNKCWYCESKDIRSDTAVDHFRPKNQVAESPDHPGYWWLSFDWKNYRFTCTFCNSRRGTAADETSGGKHDHFPLFNPKQRAYSPGDNIALERPQLLDPLVPADPTLLLFLDDGNPHPRYSQQEDADAYTRADASIKLYHLKHYLLNARRSEIFRQVGRLIKMGDDGDTMMAHNRQLGEERRNGAISGIRQLTHPDSPHSAAAADFVDGFRRAGRKWLAGVH